MRRLLKIREFIHLKKRNLVEERSGDGERPAKRHRKSSSLKSADQPSAIGAPIGDAWQKEYERFLAVFENDRAKESVWWLPGRRGEAFAMHKERFERNILKSQLEEHSLSYFLQKLKRWGFYPVNIASLSGRILAFEKSPPSPTKRFSSPPQERKKSGESNNGRHHRRVGGTSADTARLLAGTSQGSTQGGSASLSLALANLSSVQLRQAQYMVQQELAQTYFTLLWQELQRQLSLLLLQQTQSNSPQLPASPGSEIMDLAVLLQQQQVQQQAMAVQFIRANIVQPATQQDQETVEREITELQHQQLSNLTYQIVALVAANLEHNNQSPQLPEAPTLQRILVKYMIALVLLQLQQQQHNLEFFRQERLTALARVRPGRNSEAESLHMQQLLSEAAMLSLSRAHQLLCEAAILIPAAANQPSQIHPAGHGTPPPPFPGSDVGPHSPRTTTAR